MNSVDWFETILDFLLWAFCSTVGAIVAGFTLSVLWGWFIVPTFNVAPLGIVPAIGIDVSVAYLLSHLASKSDLNKENVLTMFVRSLATSALFLFLGFVVHHFM